tara:strand:+ start:388 stop:654 length:267 start_codon:yes stop_codon:yes gene_type:complete
MIEIILLIFGVIVGFGITISSTIIANKNSRKLYESIYAVPDEELTVPSNELNTDTEDSYNWETYEDSLNKFGLPEEGEELESYDKDKN